MFTLTGRLASKPRFQVSSYARLSKAVSALVIEKATYSGVGHVLDSTWSITEAQGHLQEIPWTLESIMKEIGFIGRENSDAILRVQSILRDIDHQGESVALAGEYGFTVTPVNLSDETLLYQRIFWLYAQYRRLLGYTRPEDEEIRTNIRKYIKGRVAVWETNFLIYKTQLERRQYGRW